MLVVLRMMVGGKIICQELQKHIQAVHLQDVTVRNTTKNINTRNVLKKHKILKDVNGEKTRCKN